MRIVLASSEAVPFAKTGGLADVVSALAKALADLGHQVWVILPHYPQLLPRDLSPPIEPANVSFPVPVGARAADARRKQNSRQPLCHSFASRRPRNRSSHNGHRSAENSLQAMRSLLATMWWLCTVYRVKLS